eukprot:m51a1_g11203 hypothetical protein (76) ;mRNA; f:26017-26403
MPGSVNFSPSLGVDCALDAAVKGGLVRGLLDTLALGCGGAVEGRGGWEALYPDAGAPPLEEPREAAARLAALLLH